MNFRTVIQTISLIFFIILILLTSFPLKTWFPVDFFLRLDPLIFLGTVISSRQWVWALIPGLIIIILTLFMGRFFCGYICPMGTTIDLTDRVLKKTKEQSCFDKSRQSRFEKIKYFILFFILGTAFMGVSSVFLASPLSLVTRLYALVIYPGLVFLSDTFLEILMPVSIWFSFDFLTYAQPDIYLFSSQWFIVIFFMAVFLMVCYSPRFWCRYLCPSGALMALLSKKPVISRQVSDECTNCGLCQKKCPMNAIDPDPKLTLHQECIVCETCVRVCPEQAVSFGIKEKKRKHKADTFLPARRLILTSAFSGVGTAVLLQTGISQVKSDLLPGNILPRSLIRPPGAVPEEEFQTKCIRCGQCMKVCPSNTLQPIWFEAGPGAVFSPKVLPRRGPCDPMCNACGQVCPTGALRKLPLEEKMWARIGTSYVIPHKCLAWEWERECLVCYEVCPYAAIELKREDGISVPVPYISANKCSGCGACEYHCPVQAGSAIVVEPMEALRLSRGSYIEAGKAIGFELEADPDRQRKPPDYLFDSDDPDDLPPGFSF
ncbi:MAG: 4Fe-4S binding protein [Desulfonatronovibrio sp.]|nr:4Fe-4S binding protein [Desulfovibrionales bacterium]